MKLKIPNPFKHSDGDGDEHFHECPNCSRNSPGKIWRCDDCGLRHCDECDSSSGNCPNCGSDDLSVIGYIN